MKLPQTPPNLSAERDKLLQEPDKFIRAFSLDATDDKGRYLHWDDFRFKPMPEGLTAVEAWVGTKMARNKQMRDTVFHDKQGRPFRFMETDAIRRLLHRIDSMAHGQIATATPLNNQATAKPFHIASLILEAFSSSRLEGAATTRERAKEIIREGRDPRDKSERMVLNNFHAMEFIGRHKADPLSPSLVLELHKIVTEKTLDREAMAGVLRTPTDDVVVDDDEDNVLHIPPLAETLPGRLQLLCDFANHQGEQHRDTKIFVHPIIQAIILHFMIGYDHPFIDGNGRTARALFYWHAIKEGYWLLEYVSISKVIFEGAKQYGRAYLETETDDSDLTYFIQYQLQIIDKAIKELHAHLVRKVDELQKFEANLVASDGTHGLNYRQIEVLKFCIERPNAMISIQEHQRKNRISYQTARNDLLSLTDAGFLTKRTLGKAFFFRPRSDLQQRLDTLGNETSETQEKASKTSKREKPSGFAERRRGTRSN